MAIDDFGGDVFSGDQLTFHEPMSPPWILLVISGVCVVASGSLLLLWRNQTGGLIGYALAAIVAVMAVALYRYVDGRRRTLARYRPSLWAGKVSVGLLIAAWMVSCGHAWQLATMWAK